MKRGLMKVTAVIPAYNCKSTIAEAINSVLKQTYNDIEVIVINDGSTDGTDKLVKQNYPDLTLINQDNRGVSWARNTGIKHSHGDLIAFLDADDIWLPEKIERQVDIFSHDQDIGLVTTEEYIFDGYENIHNQNKEISLFKGDIVKNIFWKSGLCTSTVMVRKTVLDDVGEFRTELSAGEDDNLWIRIAFKYKVHLIKEPLVKYRITSNSLTRGETGRSNLYNGVKKHIDILRKEYPEISMRLGNLDRKLAELYFDHGLSYLDLQQLKLARINFINAFKHDFLKTKYIFYYLVCFFPGSMISFLKSVKQKF